jgi:hypothetical protein
MAVLTVQDMSLAGVTDALVAAAGGGDSFDNNGLCLFVVNNASGGAITVTFDDPQSPNPGNAVAFNPDVTVSVPAAGRRTIGPFPPFRFNDPNGRVQVAYSGVTSLTVGVYRIRP